VKCVLSANGRNSNIWRPRRTESQYYNMFSRIDFSGNSAELSGQSLTCEAAYANAQEDNRATNITRLCAVPATAWCLLATPSDIRALPKSNEVGVSAERCRRAWQRGLFFVSAIARISCQYVLRKLLHSSQSESKSDAVISKKYFKRKKLN
jgi:hypothetical protein